MTSKSEHIRLRIRQILNNFPHGAKAGEILTLLNEEKISLSRPTSPRSRVPCPASTPFICRTTRKNKKPLMDTGIPHLTMTKSALTVLPSRLPSAV